MTLFVSTGTHRSLMTIHLESTRRSWPENWNSHATWISMSSKIWKQDQAQITNRESVWVCVSRISISFGLLQFFIFISLFYQAALKNSLINMKNQIKNG